MSNNHGIGLNSPSLQDPSMTLGLGDASAGWLPGDPSFALAPGTSDAGSLDAGAAFAGDHSVPQLASTVAATLLKPITVSVLPGSAPADGNGSPIAAAAAFGGGDAMVAAL